MFVRVISSSIVLLFIASLLSSVRAEVSTWTDSTGKFKVEAEFVSADGESVLLRQPNGKEVKIPLAKLSTADRVRAVQLAAEVQPAGVPAPRTSDPLPAAGEKEPGPLKVGDAIEIFWGNSWYPGKVLKVEPERYFVSYDDYADNWNTWLTIEKLRRPGETKAGASPFPNRPNFPADFSEIPRNRAGFPDTSALDAAALEAFGSDNIASGPELTAMNYQGRQVAYQAGIDTWKLAKAAPRSFESISTKPLPLPPAQDFFEKPTKMILDPVRGYAAITFVNINPTQSGGSRSLWANLATGKPIGEIRLAHKGTLLDIQPNGRLTAAAAVGRPGFDPPRVDIYELTGKDSMRHVKSFTPEQPNRQAVFRDLEMLTFVDGGMLFSYQRNGNLVLWNLADSKVEYQLELNGWSAPAFTTDRKYFAGVFKKGVGVFEVASGNQIASIDDLPVSNRTTVAFNDDGSLLAVAAADRLLTLDTGSGRQLANLKLSAAVRSSLIWLSPRYVLIDNQYVHDLERNLRLWHYKNSSGGQVLQFAGQTWFMIQPWANNLGAVVTASLPHEAAISAGEKIRKQDLMLLHPGDGIRVTDNTGRASADLEKMITAAGYKVDPSSSLELIATVTSGEQQEIRYRAVGFGARGDSTTHTYTPQTSRVELKTADGKVAWASGITTSPDHYVDESRGESVEAAVAQASQPNYEFFGRASMPELILRPEFQAGLGSSEITTGGLQ